MNEQKFNKLIKKDRYQVFLFSSPIPRPLSFIVHTWIVTVNKGNINRWEVWEFPNCCKTSWGHVHLNLFKPWIGIRKNPFGEKLRFESLLLGMIEGKKGSIAEKMVNFITKNCKNYPFTNNYKYILGPNSNSFIKWILNKFPETNLKLPWNAFGKGYKNL